MSRQAPIIRQAVMPVVTGDSSPLTAEIDASSMSRNPSVVAPVAIFRAPRFVNDDARRSASAARLPISTARSARASAVSMSPAPPAASLPTSAR
jgi:hypothetical protein